MNTRMVGYYCPNGHLHEGIAYYGPERCKDMFKLLVEEKLELACRECGVLITAPGWKYQDTVVPDCNSLDEFAELAEVKHDAI